MKHKFYSLAFLSLCIAPTVSGATFTSASSGSFTTPGTWTVVGSDADGIPDNNDDIIITSGRNVSLTTASYCQNLTINLGGSLTGGNQTLNVYGSFTNNGSCLGNASLQFRAVGVLSGNPVNFGGSWYFWSNYTIASSMTLIKQGTVNLAGGVVVTNNGSVTLNSNSSLSLYTLSKWTNAANSFLSLSANVANTGGQLACGANNNTVVYTSNGYTQIETSGNYYNLTLQTTSANSKLVPATLTVLNNLTISTGVTLNMNNQQINLGGNWTNNANTNCTSLGLISFTGSGTQTITRTATERFRHMDLNGTGTVLLGTNLTLVGNLNINSGTLDVSASNFSITITGNFVDGGTFNKRQGTVTFNGTVAQTIDGSSVTHFYNLVSTNAAGVSTNFSKTIDNLLSVNAGTFGPSGSGQLTMDATGPTTYGRIGPVLGTLVGTGWRIKSYINGPATAYWQYLSTPINGNRLNDWDADTRFYMSGVGGNDGNACCPTFFSVRTYNTAANTYSNVTSINTVLVNGKGYMVWMSDNMSALASPLIYDSRGAANFGNKTINVTAGGAGSGYNLVGNPYACSINYSSVVSASGNLNANFLILQENGSYVTNPNGGVIAPNQGFMAIATSTGLMRFNEACKNTTISPNIIRMADPENYLRINVRSVVNGLGSEAVVNFRNEATSRYDVNYDMPHLNSPYEEAANIWTVDDDGKDELLNAMNATEDEVTVPVYVSPGVYGQHDLSFQGVSGIDEYSCVWLEDPENGQRIDLSKQSTYSFTVNTLGVDKKFLLHFERGEGCRLSQNTNVSGDLDAQTSVFTSGDNLVAKFSFTELTDASVTVYDMRGNKVSEQQFNVGAESKQLDVPQAHGIYLVRIATAKETVTKKIFY